MEYYYYNLDTNIEDSGLNKLSSIFKFIPKLKILNLSDNNIDDDGMLKFSDSLKYLPNLESLLIKSNKIKEVGAKYLSNSFKYIHNLKELSISDNIIGDEGVLSIAENINNLPKLTTLLMWSVKKTNGLIDGFEVLAKNFGNINNLMILDLSGIMEYI